MLRNLGLALILLTTPTSKACTKDQKNRLLQSISRLAKNSKLSSDFKKIIERRAFACKKDPALNPDSFLVSKSMLFLLRSIAKNQPRKRDRKNAIVLINSFDGTGRPIYLDLASGTATVDFNVSLLGKTKRIKKLYSDSPTDQYLFTTYYDKMKESSSSGGQLSLSLPLVQFKDDKLTQPRFLPTDLDDLLRSDLTFFTTGKLNESTFYSAKIHSDSPFEDFLEGKLLDKDGATISIAGSIVKQQGQWYFDASTKYNIYGEKASSGQLGLTATQALKNGAQQFGIYINKKKDVTVKIGRQTLDDEGRLRSLKLDILEDGVKFTGAQQLTPALTGSFTAANIDGKETYEVLLNAFDLIGIGLEKQDGKDIQLLLSKDVYF